MQPDASVRPEASVQPDASPPAAFELQGDWVFLGPGSLEHTLKIGGGSMVFTDVNGAWSSNWTTKDYDNGLHHFEIVFKSGTGTYFPVGQNVSGTYVLDAMILTLQLANGLGSYAPVTSPGSCTEGAGTPIANCNLYMKQ